MVKRIPKSSLFYPIIFYILLCNVGGCAPKFICWPYSKESPNLARQIVKTAQSQIGTRYIYGGCAPKGFDCSGLIWWAYKKHGVHIPRVTEGQAKAGVSIKKRAIRPGDILVFKIRARKTSLHTGMYVGDGKFIHSPRKGKRVRHDNLENTYWKKRLNRIRRIIR